MTLRVHIIKIGGSLLDLPQLPQRLNEVISQSDANSQLLITGGGQCANVVRQWDAIHHIGEQTCHWIAIRAMQFNTHLLATVLPDAAIISSKQQLQSGKVHLLDPFAWLEREQQQGITIPHLWQFTSDSVAAHLAKQLQSPRLTLCKSTLPKNDCGLSCAAELGIVDKQFPNAAAGLPYVELINLRDENLPAMILES